MGDEKQHGVVGAETPRLPGRKMRWWMPAILLIAAAGAIIYARTAEELESMWRFIIPMLVCMFTPILLGLWYALFTQLPWKRRLILVGEEAVIVVVFALGFGLLFRNDGASSGVGVPSFVWRWTPKRAEAGKLEVKPATVVLTAGSTDYPRFLGANGNAEIKNANLKADWTVPPKEMWRREVGLGWSGFVIVGEHAITQEQRGDYELTVCYNLKTGEPEWKHGNNARFSEQMGGDGPRATPTVENGRVYVMGATGILDCLDATNGNAVWSRDVLVENNIPNIEWGKSCSPLIAGDAVVVTGGKSEGPSLLAFNKTDGKPLWTAGKDRASYVSPTLATLAGREQIVSVNKLSITGHDLKSGAILWNYAWLEGEQLSNRCSQPVILEPNRIFASCGYGVGCVLLEIQSDMGVKEVWKNRNLKSKFSNIVRRGNYVYGIDDETLACIDLETGQRKWKSGRYAQGQMMLADDLIVILGEKGEVALVEAKPEGYKEVARMQALESKTWNNPALSNGYLLVRNDREAVCLKLPEK